MIMPGQARHPPIGSSALRRAYSPSDMGQSLLQVDSYGGAVKRVSATETAMRQRSSIMKLQYQTYWINATRPLQWSERGAARMESDAGRRRRSWAGVCSPRLPRVLRDCPVTGARPCAAREGRNGRRGGPATGIEIRWSDCNAKR